jgi:hypothetical protein
MKSIKFRAWDGKNMRLDVTGFEHGNKNEMAGIFLDGDYYAIKGSTATESTLLTNPNAEVMQFTGLSDKNGVDIYEGDIVVNSDLSGSGQPRVFNPREVRWFADSCNFNVSRVTALGATIEVIGNIHENPELLESN